MNLLKNKRIFAAPAIIGIVVVIFSLSSNALAQTVPGGASMTDLTAQPWWSLAAKYAVAGIGALGVMFMSLMALFAAMVGGLFDYAITLNLDFGTNRSVIELGWGVARDTANLFFILILLIIAVMTILRVSSYQAKSMFVRFIIVAILINFSLTFCLILVDFTNILGKGFYDALRPSGQSISTTIINNSKLQAIWNFRGESQASAANKEQGFIKKLFTGQYSPIPPAYNYLKTLFGTFTESLEQATAFAKIAWGNTILLSVLVFVMLVSAVFLLIRVAMLAILLVVSPLAFISVILPGAEGISQKWWKSFFNHAFYFPAFLFLMYFSVAFTSRIAQATPDSNFLEGSPALLMGYFVAVIMMIASVIIAKEMGLQGANAVMKGATTGRQWVTGYVGMQTIGRLGQRLQQSETVQRTQIGRNVTNKMVGVGAKTPMGSIKQRGDEKAEWLAKQAPQEWIKGIKALGASGREKFIQSIPDQARGKFLADLKNTDPAMYETTMNTLKVRLGAKALKDFEKAEVQQDMKGKRGAELGVHLDNLAKNIRDGGGTDSQVDTELKKYFKAMSNEQRGDLLEAWHSDDRKLDMIMKWKDQDLDLEEQDKFIQSLRKASNPAIESYMKALAKDKKVVEEDLVLRSLSSQQKVHLWDKALGNSAEAAQAFQDKISKLLPEDVSGFNKAASSHIQSKQIPDMVKIWEKLPENIRQSVISSQKVTRTNAMYREASEETKKIIHKDVMATGIKDKVNLTPGKRVFTALTPKGQSGEKILNEIRSEEDKNNKS